MDDIPTEIVQECLKSILFDDRIRPILEKAALYAPKLCKILLIEKFVHTILLLFPELVETVKVIKVLCI
jgi:hypothetical protein